MTWGRKWQPVGRAGLSRENNPLPSPRPPQTRTDNTGEKHSLPPLLEAGSANENPGALGGATGMDHDEVPREFYARPGAEKSSFFALLLRQVVEAHPDLGLEGFGSKWRIDPTNPDHLAQFEASRRWLAKQPVGPAMGRGQTSYGLKHQMRTYAYGGIFLAAAISLGLPFQRVAGERFALLPLNAQRRGRA